MPDFTPRKTDIFAGINDVPRAATALLASNGADLVDRMNGLIDDLNAAFVGTEITLDTTNFDDNLSAADTNVQLAMETLNDLATGNPAGGSNNQIQFGQFGYFFGFGYVDTGDDQGIIGNASTAPNYLVNNANNSWIFNTRNDGGGTAVPGTVQGITSTGGFNTMVGGDRHGIMSGINNFTFAGTNNFIRYDGNSSTQPVNCGIIGGFRNIMDGGSQSFIIGGQFNDVEYPNRSVILGGAYNIFAPQGGQRPYESIILGGQGQDLNGTYRSASLVSYNAYQNETRNALMATSVFSTIDDVSYTTVLSSQNFYSNARASGYNAFNTFASCIDISGAWRIDRSFVAAVDGDSNSLGVDSGSDATFCALIASYNPTIDTAVGGTSLNATLATRDCTLRAFGATCISSLDVSHGIGGNYNSSLSAGRLSIFGQNSTAIASYYGYVGTSGNSVTRGASLASYQGQIRSGQHKLVAASYYGYLQAGGSEQAVIASSSSGLLAAAPYLNNVAVIAANGFTAVDQSDTLFTDNLKVRGDIILTSTSSRMIVPVVTTAERDALTLTPGIVVYNTTTTNFEGRKAASWATLG